MPASRKVTFRTHRQSLMRPTPTFAKNVIPFPHESLLFLLSFSGFRFGEKLSPSVTRKPVEKFSFVAATVARETAPGLMRSPRVHGQNGCSLTHIWSSYWYLINESMMNPKRYRTGRPISVIRKPTQTGQAGGQPGPRTPRPATETRSSRYSHC